MHVANLYISVSDNGVGISPEDMQQHVGLRHATSKLGCLADLREPQFKYRGFRGESLSNIVCASSALEVEDNVCVADTASVAF